MMLFQFRRVAFPLSLIIASYHLSLLYQVASMFRSPVLGIHVHVSHIECR